MLRVLYSLIKDFGTLGAVLASIVLNGFLFYKLFTNHLAHLAKDVKDVKNTVEGLESDMDATKQRVSKIEGILD